VAARTKTNAGLCKLETRAGLPRIGELTQIGNVCVNRSYLDVCAKSTKRELTRTTVPLMTLMWAILGSGQ